MLHILIILVSYLKMDAAIIVKATCSLNYSIAVDTMNGLPIQNVGYILLPLK
jgi:hypothetical protein